MYFDYTYLIFIIPALIFTMIAQLAVKSTFNRYSRVRSSTAMTGREAAEAVLAKYGVRGVKITRVSGSLTDHYDPRTYTVALSESVYDSCSVAAIGVAAHEAGHAAQYDEEYFPMKLRAAVIPVTNIGSRFALPLVILGLIFSFYPLAYAGILLFATVVLFQLITLPVEFNASRRAVEALSEISMPAEELSGSKSVLRAAALTYVAALFMALMNLLRLISLVNRRR